MKTNRTQALQKAKAALKPLGMTIIYRRELEEYRVNFAGGAEDTASYHDDLEDALGTAKDMARRRVELRATLLTDFDKRYLHLPIKVRYWFVPSILCAQRDCGKDR